MTGSAGRIALYWIALLSLGMFSGCGEKGPDKDAVAASAPTVVVADVEQRDVTDVERFIGRVEAADTIDLRARVEGFVERKAARNGQTVEAGETLFVIEPEPYVAGVDKARADVAEAKAALDFAELDLGRKQELVERDTISEREYDVAAVNRDSAKARLSVVEALLKQAQIRLGYTEIKAPFPGRLGRIAYSDGDVVGPASGPLVNLTRISPIYVSVALAERDLVTILEAYANEKGEFDLAHSTTVKVTLPNGSVLPEDGRIVFSDNRVDPATGTINVRAEFENTQGLLVPGAFVNVNVGGVQADRRNVIPQAALQRDQKGAFVLVVKDNGQVEQRYVELGRQLGADVVVDAGIEPGEKIIVEGLQRVRPGQPVETVPAASPES